MFDAALECGGAVVFLFFSGRDARDGRRYVASGDAARDILGSDDAGDPQIELVARGP